MLLKSKKPNRDKLVRLIHHYNITTEQIGAWLDRKPGTVQAWTQKYSGVDISDHSLELLRYKIADAIRMGEIIKPETV